MIKKISVENFLSFTEMTFDFTSTGNRPLNHAVIYGENGSGKTNLVRTVAFLKESVSTLAASDRRAETYDLCDLCQIVRQIGSEGAVRVRYDMEIDGMDVTYSMSFEGDVLAEETLRAELNRNKGTVFHIVRKDGRIEKEFWGSLFRDDGYRKDVDSKIERQWGKHSLLAIIGREFEINNAEYMESVFGKVKKVIDGINGICVNVRLSAPPTGHGFPSVVNLERGTVGKEGTAALDAYGAALNRFFRRIYHGVVRVYYEYEWDLDSDRTGYALMFVRKMDGKEVTVPSVKESGGTRSLIRHFDTLMGCASGRTAFIDEIDNGIHDKLMFDMMSQILPKIKGQLIITTHNTGLLRTIKARNAFVMDVDSEGYKDFRPFSEGKRTMANNNNQKRYLNDEFGGIPYICEIDLENISNHLTAELERI